MLTRLVTSLGGLDAGGGASGDFVKLDDLGTAQTITGGGGLNVEFGTDGAVLNIAPMNEWSCYPGDYLIMDGIHLLLSQAPGDPNFLVNNGTSTSTVTWEEIEKR